MAEDNPESYEMKERIRNLPEETPEEGEGNTSFIEPNTNDPLIDPTQRPDLDRSIRIIDTSIPKTKLDLLGTIESIYTEDKIKFLSKHLNIKVGNIDAESSRTLLHNIELTVSKRGKIDGFKYRGVKIVVLHDGKMTYSTAYARVVNEFKELAKEAELEYEKTLSSDIEKQVGEASSETIQEIRRSVPKDLENIIDDEGDSVICEGERLGVSQNVQNEVMSTINTHESHEALVKGTLHRQTGISYKEKIEVLEKDHEHWKELANKETDKNISNYYRAVSRIAALEADLIQIKYDLKPQTEEVKEIFDYLVEKNILTRFEMFKEWVKENLGSLATVAIAIGGIITTIVMATKASLKKVGGTLKDIKNSIKK